MFVPLASILGLAAALDVPCNPRVEPGCVAHNSALRAQVWEPLQTEPKFFAASMPLPAIVFDGQGARLGIYQRLDNPQLTSNEYILYGKVEADIRGSAATGIISSLYLQSDDLDEIDIVEMFGGIEDMYQTNFFVKGQTGAYDRGQDVAMATPPHAQFHRYGVEWTPDAIEWLFDGRVVRRVARDNPHGFPMLPMRVMASCWAGGDSGNSPGTIEWAGGETDYSQMPFFMHVRNLRVENYSDGEEYVYAMRQRLKIVTGRNFYGRKKYEVPTAMSLEPRTVKDWAVFGAAAVQMLFM